MYLYDGLLGIANAEEESPIKAAHIAFACANFLQLRPVIGFDYDAGSHGPRVGCATFELNINEVVRARDAIA